MGIVGRSAGCAAISEAIVFAEGLVNGMKGCGGRTGLSKIIASVENVPGLYTIINAVEGSCGFPTMMAAEEGSDSAAAIHKSAGGSDGVAQTMKNICAIAGLVAASNAIGNSISPRSSKLSTAARALLPSSLAWRAPTDCTSCSMLLATLPVSSSFATRFASLLASASL